MRGRDLDVDHPLGWGLWLAVLAMLVALAACGGDHAPPRDPPEVMAWRQAADEARAVWADPATPYAKVAPAVARWRHYQALVDAWEAGR